MAQISNFNQGTFNILTCDTNVQTVPLCITNKCQCSSLRLILKQTRTNGDVRYWNGSAWLTVASGGTIPDFLFVQTCPSGSGACANTGSNPASGIPANSEQMCMRVEQGQTYELTTVTSSSCSSPDITTVNSVSGTTGV